MAEFTMIGVHAEELPWLRMLVALLRHPDPGVAELVRQALLYLTDAAGKRGPQRRGSCDAAG